MIAVAIVLFVILCVIAWWYRAWKITADYTAVISQACHHEQMEVLVDIRDAIRTVQLSIEMDAQSAVRIAERNMGLLRQDLNVLHNDLERIAIHIPVTPPQTIRLPG